MPSTTSRSGTSGCQATYDHGGVTRREDTCRDRGAHDGLGGDHGSVAHLRARQQQTARTDPDVAAEQDLTTGTTTHTGDREVAVGDDGSVAQQREAADADAAVRREHDLVDGAVVADVDGTVGAELEAGPGVDARVPADPNRRVLAATTATQPERAVEPAALTDDHVARQRVGVPVVRQLRDTHDGTDRAGLPWTRMPAATEVVTTAPAAISAPAPMRTPFRISAPAPIRTPSSTTIGSVTNGTRSA